MFLFYFITDSLTVALVSVTVSEKPPAKQTQHSLILE